MAHADLLSESAVTRAWTDFRSLSLHGWWFRILTGAVTAALAIWGALLPANASTPVRILLAVGGSLGGALIVGGIALLTLLVLAPLRQRNDLRQALTSLQLSEGPSPQELVRRYSEWVQATRAKLPTFPRSSGRLIYWNKEAQEKLAAEQTVAVGRYEEAKDQVERRARGEYHEQFRDELVNLLDTGDERIDNPRTIDDFEEIEREAVRHLAETSEEAPEEAVNRVLRRLRALLLNELRANRGKLSQALKRETYWQQNDGLKTGCWEETGSDFAEHAPGSQHADVSAAYAQIDALNEDALNTWRAMEAHYGYDPPPGRPPTIKGNEEALEAALNAIATAEKALGAEHQR